MTWFGEPWPSPAERAPVCEDDAQRVPTPIDMQCASCEELIGENDRGTLFANGEPCHAECGLRDVLGGAGHLATEPHRPGGCDPDGGLSRRESALLVWEWVDRMGVENLIGAAQYPRVREGWLQVELEARRGATPDADVAD